jgi:RNA polymerase-interacting CarD/CdnL/TRCF family regulator
MAGDSAVPTSAAVVQGLTASQDSDDLDKASNTVQKFKEKNRAAQRRYRERQKVRVTE